MPNRREKLEPWIEYYKGNLNPYLFLLLKECIKLDASIFNNVTEPNREEIISYINRPNAEYSYGGDGVAPLTLANHVRRYIWNKEVFQFQKRELDLFAQCVQLLGPYNSWADFCMLHSQHVYALNAEFLREKKFDELDVLLRKNILAEAQKTVRLLSRQASPAESLKNPKLYPQILNADQLKNELASNFEAISVFNANKQSHELNSESKPRDGSA